MNYNIYNIVQNALSQLFTIVAIVGLAFTGILYLVHLFQPRPSKSAAAVPPHEQAAYNALYHLLEHAERRDDGYHLPEAAVTQARKIYNEIV